MRTLPTLQNGGCCTALLNTAYSKHNVSDGTDSSHWFVVWWETSKSMAQGSRRTRTTSVRSLSQWGVDCSQGEVLESCRRMEIHLHLPEFLWYEIFSCHRHVWTKYVSWAWRVDWLTVQGLKLLRLGLWPLWKELPRWRSIDPRIQEPRDQETKNPPSGQRRGRKRLAWAVGALKALEIWKEERGSVTRALSRPCKWGERVCCFTAPSYKWTKAEGMDGVGLVKGGGVGLREMNLPLPSYVLRASVV